MFGLAGAKKYISNYKQGTSPQIRKLLLLDILINIIWFVAETTFVFVIQGLLVSMQFIPAKTAYLPSWYPDDFLINVAILLGFGIFRSVALMLKHYSILHATQVYICEKRSELLQRSLRSQLQLSNNDVVSAFSELVSHASNHLVYSINLVNGLIVSGLFMVTCIRIAPLESIAGISCLLVFLQPLKKLTKDVKAYGNELIENWNSSQETLLNGLRNIFFLNIHHLTEDEIIKGRGALKKYKDNYHSYGVISSLLLGLPQILGIFVLCFTAWLGFRFLNTPPAVLVSFFYLFIRLVQNAAQTNNYISYFKLTLQSFNRLNEVLADFKKIPRKKGTIKLSKEDGLSITLDSLVIGYSSEKALTKPLNIEWRKNTLFLVKGPSGKGKTTLLKTIIGYQPAISGNVMINGVSVPDIANLEELLGYVGPEPFLLYGTVRENLLYGNRLVIKDEEILHILELLDLKEKILQLPKGLGEILLDETQLSSGQKQRLAIGRALLRRPQLLILDEATANIDPETENKIVQLISSLKKNMTIFAISHKSSFDSVADLKYQFDEI